MAIRSSMLAFSEFQKRIVCHTRHSRSDPWFVSWVTYEPYASYLSTCSGTCNPVSCSMPNDSAPDDISSACNVLETSSHHLADSTCTDLSGEDIPQIHQQVSAADATSVEPDQHRTIPWMRFDPRTTHVKYDNADVHRGVDSSADQYVHNVAQCNRVYHAWQVY